MHVSREQLESAVSKWFDGSISDYKCEALASTYLEHQYAMHALPNVSLLHRKTLKRAKLNSIIYSTQLQ